ncbi:MAG: DNA replication/repair protein RecF [Lachnospiraceae bacterium]|nr:DNA replication/repair protein RecF [Lachnospiraceae bacterium]
MYIKSLELNNFRNYNSLNISFENDTNILYGDNAQGKTNILESIYLAATTKSHRGNKDKEVIMFDHEEAHIKLIVIKQNVPLRIDMHLKKNKTKGIAINGIPIKKASELFGTLNVVFFSPEDLNIIKNGPSERRKFIDMELCQLDKIYVHNLITYNKILNQRNKLLKDIGYVCRRADLINTLDILDIQIARYGKEIISRRERFIQELNHIICKIHSKITDKKENLVIRYEPNLSGNNINGNVLNKNAMDENLIYESLVHNRERDLKLGSTSTGPHRDDIGFYNYDMDIRKFGSQGQQRTAALSLKLSEIELVRQVIKDVPILLLDDVLSELDSSRQKHLLDSIDKVQTIITCTGLDEFIENRFTINNVYKVINGTIERSSNE